MSEQSLECIHFETSGHYSHVFFIAMHNQWSKFLMDIKTSCTYILVDQESCREYVHYKRLSKVVLDRVKCMVHTTLSIVVMKLDHISGSICV